MSKVENCATDSVNSIDWLGKVYGVLVELGGADESMKPNFIHTHLNEACREWRFCGELGFGGKYRIGYNRVDYYSEDETPERKALAQRINEVLATLPDSVINGKRSPCGSEREER